MSLQRRWSWRRAGAAYLAAVGGGYLAFGLIGFFAPPPTGEPVAPSEAAEALAFAFRSEGLDATEVSAAGSISHGWLIRSAYVHGWDTSTGETRSEQVLKVGWPFTMVRGFVRTSGGEVRAVDSVLLRGDPLNGTVRYWPIQPVWPGLLFDSLWIAGLFLLVTSMGRGRQPGAKD